MPESMSLPIAEKSEECSPLDHAVFRARELESDIVQLEDASKTGDIDAVRQIFHHWLERSESERSSIDRFASSFHYAMNSCRINIASFLVVHGVAINEFHFKLAMVKKCYAFLQLALDHGFDINKPWGEYEATPLAHAFHDEAMTKWFLDRGADPNAQTRSGITPLSKAVVSAPLTTIKLLVDRGGPDSIRYGLLLHHIVYRQDQALEVLEYLFQRGIGDQINHIQYHDCPELYREENLIVGCGTPLHDASREGRSDIVEFFLSHGADPRIADGKGRLAVELARGACYESNANILAKLA